MSNYDASIIRQGDTPSMFNSFVSGQQVGRQNALANLYKTQWAGIANGDQNALNALAQFDPQAAMSARASNFDFQQAQATARQQAEAHAAKMSAAEAERAAEEIKRAVAGGMAAQTPEQWDAFVAPIAPDLVGQFGNRDTIAQSYMSVADVMEQRSKAADPTKGAPDGYMWNTPGNAAAGVSPIPGIDNSPEWRDATPDEAARYGAAFGQINNKTGKFQAIEAPRGMTLESDGKGGFRMVQGAGVGQGGESPKVDVTSPAAMVSTIDGILNDPALNTATGMLSFTQAIPGTPQYRVGTRIRQLNGQAFLQAFESLKGGGQITENEGTKATEAIGRLDSAQSPDDYRNALTELRDILIVAQSRPQGWATQQGAAAAKFENAPPVGTIEGNHRFLGGDPADQKNWEQLQ